MDKKKSRNRSLLLFSGGQANILVGLVYQKLAKLVKLK